MNSIKNTFKSKAAKDEIRKRVELYGNTEALRLEGEAKRNRQWTDRTADARNSIQGKFEWKGNVGYIYLSGNMEYSVFLELAMEKRYAVLLPTIEKHATEIMKGYKQVINS